MSDLNAQSTNEEVWESYDDNVSYEEDSSASKCRAFITAANILLRRRPARSVVGGADIQFDSKAVSDQLAYARSWLANNPGTSAALPSRPAVIHWNLSNVRGAR